VSTRYIDFANGSDSNAGTKLAPWKLCPGMVGFAGSYSHAAGDQFIFKGGVTWNLGGVNWTISNSGGSSSVRDYYGADQTWFNGSSFVKPILDFQQTTSHVTISGSNLTFDNLEIARHRDTYSFASATFTSYGTFNNVGFTNCVVRDWDMATPIVDGNAGNGGGIGYFGGGGGNGWSIDHCTFHQLNAGVITGTAIYNVFGGVSFCEIYHTASAIHAGGAIHDNHIHDILNASDTNSHQDSISTYSASVIYNNLIHDTVGRAAPIQLNVASTSVANAVDLVYNNVIFNAGVQTPILSKADNAAYGSYTMKVFNNTIEHGSAYCVMAEVGSPGQAFGAIYVQNNHFITTATPVLYNNNGAGGATVTTAVVDHNTTQTPTAATNSGYTTTNFYQPTSGASPTVNAGISLASIFTTDRLGITRPQGASWDDGAYEFVGGGGGQPNVNGTITLPAQNVTITQGQSVVFNGSTSGAFYTPPLSYLWNFGASGVANSTALNPGSVTFVNAGVFTVTFTASDSSGVTDPTPDTRTITVNVPPNNPVLTVSTPTIDFGFVDFGQISNLSFTVQNTGTGTLTGVATTSAPFSVVSGGNYSLAAGQSQSVFVRYTPGGLAAYDSGLVTLTGGMGATSALVGRSAFGLVFDAKKGFLSPPMGSIDSVNVYQNVLTTDPTQAGRAYYEFIVTNAGDYTITGKVDAPAASQYLTATINDSVLGTGNNQWQYDSNWFQVNSPASAYQGDEHYAFATNATAHFRFNGTQVKIYTTKEPAGGNIGYTLDGGSESVVSNYASVQVGNQLSYTSAIVTSGDHDLAIRVVGSHESSSSSNTITVDKAEVYTTTTAAFFVNVDAEPTSPTMIWDITPTSGLEDRTTSWRGNGTAGSPQFSTKTFSSLTMGKHKLYVRGFGANTKLNTITFNSVSSPPAAAIGIDNATLVFGSVVNGQTKNLNLTVTNIGGGTLSGAATSSSAKFVVTNGAYSLTSGASQIVIVSYTPTSYSASDSATITLTGGGGTTSSATGTSPANAAPTVTLDAPAPGTILTSPANVTLAATASDSDGTISKVEFYNGITKLGEDLVAPYTLNLSSLTIGSYSLTAKATDSGGASTSSSPAVILTVNNPVQPIPAISITSPLSGSIYTLGNLITIQANTSSVTKVDYYSDGIMIGTDNQTPHNFIWTTAPLGAHNLTAVATDNLNNMKTSNSVAIIVLAAPHSADPVPIFFYVIPNP
jgi:hypothetical protein